MGSWTANCGATGLPIADELSQAGVFHSLMQDNGKNYVPASGKGGQHWNMEEAVFFAQATLRAAEKSGADLFDETD